MKILIVSDTHKRNENYFKVVEMHKPDIVVHCGDVEGSEAQIIQAANCPVYMVRGNNDFFSDLPKEADFEVNGYEIMVTHGHHYYVSMGMEVLAHEAAAKKKDIVFFGHTHKPYVEKINGVYVVNPGSISYPRQDGRRPSYCILEFDQLNNPFFNIAYL